MPKILKRILLAILTLCAVQCAVELVMAQGVARKYTIDGDVSDGGITIDDLKQGFYPNCSEMAWLPDDSNVVFIVEDNRDPNYGPASGGYPTGVHIYGKGSTYHKYDEPKIAGEAPPRGGEFYDIEAMYIDEDPDYIYVALVVSTDSEAIGDLAIDTDGNKATGGYGYDYGVLLNSKSALTLGDPQFSIYQTPSNDDWNETEYKASVPGKINSSKSPTRVGQAIGAYKVYTDLKDWDVYPTYIVEMAIPKDDIGLAGGSIGITTGEGIKYVLMKFHIASSGDCGNDFTPDFPISEFLCILIPAGIAICLAYRLRRK